MSKVIGTRLWRKCLDELANQLPERFDGSRGAPAHRRFEFGECLLDRTCVPSSPKPELRHPKPSASCWKRVSDTMRSRPPVLEEASCPSLALVLPELAELKWQRLASDAKFADMAVAVQRNPLSRPVAMAGNCGFLTQYD